MICENDVKAADFRVSVICGLFGVEINEAEHVGG